MYKNTCLFCQIAQGISPCHEVWSDDQFMAFLTIFPNTEGLTVVIPRHHQPSYLFEADEKVLAGLMLAAKKVAARLDAYYDDSVRCGVVFEGFGVDHLHAKLYPLHGTDNAKIWREIESQSHKQFFHTYPGYISTNNSDRADDAELAQLATDIRHVDLQ